MANIGQRDHFSMFRLMSSRGSSAAVLVSARIVLLPVDERRRHLMNCFGQLEWHPPDGLRLLLHTKLGDPRRFRGVLTLFSAAE